MPATFFHAYHGENVYNLLSDEVKDKINLDRMKTFAQGTDPMMFYNLISIFPGKSIRKYQKICHNTKTRDFFIELINNIKCNNYDEDSFSFLCGYICHYVLDSTFHPYIIYKSGQFNKNDKETFKYNGKHAIMEAFLDNYIIESFLNLNSNTFRVDKYALYTKRFSNNLNVLLNNSFKNVYNFENMDKYYYKAICQMKRDIYLGRYDSIGFKRCIYKLVDFITPKYFFCFESVSYYQKISKEVSDSYLNVSKKIWHYPSDYNKKSNKNFDELYNSALNEAKRLIEISYKYINGENIDLNKYFTNKSFLTGIDCNIKKKIKYFEY